MQLSETLLCVVMTTRQLAGAIIRDERARHHLTQARAAEMWKISRVTLARLEAGHETVGGLSLRHVEGGLGMPTQFLTYVVNDDRERIKRLPSRNDDPISGLREDLRHYVLDALEEIEAPHNRRANDHS